MKRKILIVEDEGIVALDLQMRLVNLGYEVTGIASSAEEALASVHQFPPDLVLMDIKLKGGSTGVQVAKTIRRELRIPVIYTSAYTDDSTYRDAKGTRPIGYIPKPYDDTELRFALELTFSRTQIASVQARAARSLQTEIIYKKDSPGAEYPPLEDSTLGPFVRLPAGIHHEQPGWRIVLLSRSSICPPILVEICDDIIIGRSDDETKVDLDLCACNGAELGVSRRHAAFQLLPGHLQLIDLGSTNGTFCNGERTLLGRPVVLSDGDELTFGNLVFRLHIIGNTL
jgi:CheY-like chemotaxis protein